MVKQLTDRHDTAPLKGTLNDWMHKGNTLVAFFPLDGENNHLWIARLSWSFTGRKERLDQVSHC